MRKYIFFKGYYGQENLGDDVFCVIADWVTHSIWSDNKPIIIGKKLPKMSNKGIIINIQNGLLQKIIELVISLFVRNIIYFGGSVFHSAPRKLIEIKQIYMRYPFVNKLGTIGTSIGPFQNNIDYDYTKSFLSKFKFVGLRDKESLDIAQKMGIMDSSCSFDIAILIEDVYPQLKLQYKGNNNKKQIGVSLCHYERYVNGDTNDEEKREEAVKNFLYKIIENRNDINEFVFFVFNGNQKNGDQNIINHFKNEFSDLINTKIVYYTKDTKKLLSEMKNCEMVIGMRLHSGILSYALDIPFILVEYHKKCTEFLNTIDHHYRFDENNMETNIQNFNTIFEEKKVPGIYNKNKFKKNIYEELERVKKIILDS